MCHGAMNLAKRRRGGRLLRERSMNGTTITDNWRFTKTYVIVDGRWRVVAWHASPAA